jgi:hypothetical protein
VIVIEDDESEDQGIEQPIVPDQPIVPEQPIVPS